MKATILTQQTFVKWALTSNGLLGKFLLNSQLAAFVLAKKIWRLLLLLRSAIFLLEQSKTKAANATAICAKTSLRRGERVELERAAAASTLQSVVRERVKRR